MHIELKTELERRLAEAQAKERELWALLKATEEWAKPALKRYEEVSANWCEQVRKCKTISAFLENEP